MLIQQRFSCAHRGSCGIKGPLLTIAFKAGRFKRGLKHFVFDLNRTGIERTR